MPIYLLGFLTFLCKTFFGNSGDIDTENLVSETDVFAFTSIFIFTLQLFAVAVAAIKIVDGIFSTSAVLILSELDTVTSKFTESWTYSTRIAKCEVLLILIATSHIWATSDKVAYGAKFWIFLKIVYFTFSILFSSAFF